MTTPSKETIARKLREDFGRSLRELGQGQAALDPVIGVLFQTIAKRLEDVYASADTMRDALLQELIEGIQLPGRSALPAQTVVQFEHARDSVFVPAGTQLRAKSAFGGEFIFATDMGISVSPAKVALALIYENSTLRLIDPAGVPDSIDALGPSRRPVSLELGKAPFLCIAIEDLPAQHLSGHGLFIDFDGDPGQIAHLLSRETWCLANADGSFPVQNVLRPRPGERGAIRLDWMRGLDVMRSPAAPAVSPDLPDGPYAGRIFAFPEVPTDKRTTCAAPLALKPALLQIFKQANALFSRPRAWLKVTLPPEVIQLASLLSGVRLHAVGASNLECLNETIKFDEHGVCVPVANGGTARKYLASVLSVFGEHGDAYKSSASETAAIDGQMYLSRPGRLSLLPPAAADTYANLRLLVTDGEVANGVPMDGINLFSGAAPIPGLVVRSIKPSAGGADQEALGESNFRLRSALLTRGRIVTRADLVRAVRAFDPRIEDVAIAPGIERTIHGLRRTQRVTARLGRPIADDASAEARLLGARLKGHLEGQMLYGELLKVELQSK